MPPVTFVGSSIGAYIGAQTWSFAIPALTKPGDTYVAVIATDTGVSGFDVDDPINVGMFASEPMLVIAGAHVFANRRIASSADVGVIQFRGDAAPAWSLAALLVFRDLAAVAAVAASGTAIAASTNFVAPSRTLTRYSDLYLGGAIVTSAATAVTHPAGTTERIEIQSGGRTLELFSYRPESTGATGTKTATTGGAQSGGAFSIAYTANGVRGSNKAFRITPPGAIGLPTEGI